jgi:hypothetical protein
MTIKNKGNRIASQVLTQVMVMMKGNNLQDAKINMFIHTSVTTNQ